jgi:hypothetical protein
MFPVPGPMADAVARSVGRDLIIQLTYYGDIPCLKLFKIAHIMGSGGLAFSHMPKKPREPRIVTRRSKALRTTFPPVTKPPYPLLRVYTPFCALW